MKCTAFAFLILLPFTLLSQATKKLSVSQPNSYIKEEYYVLKDNPTVKHGPYTKRGYGKSILETGFYKLGVRDSVWIEYSSINGKKRMEGCYAGEQKVGVWTYYDFAGEVIQKYNYSTSTLEYYVKGEQEISSTIYQNGDTVRVLADRPLLYIGGMTALSSFISKNTQYPAEARENGVSGKVYVAFKVDELGHAYAHKVLNKVGSGCDEEALRVMMALPEQWLPTIYKGQAVATRCVLWVQFKIQ